MDWDTLGVVAAVLFGTLSVSATVGLLIWRGGRWYEGVNQRLASLEEKFLRFLGKFEQRIEKDDERHEKLEEKIDHVTDTCNAIHRNGGGR